MASRIIHLAIAKRLEKELSVKDKNRFEVGQILPDAVLTADKKQSNSHFIDLYDGGKMKHYDFYAFYERYESEIPSDELYLGYYFHLIEDGIFRILLYYDLNLLSRRGDPEFLRVLYRDYHILNHCLVERYRLENTLYAPKGFGEEKINEIFRFDLADFIADMANDFTENTIGNPTYLTENRTENYIEKCVTACVSEYNAIISGKHYLKKYDFSFENKPAVKNVKE